MPSRRPTGAASHPLPPTWPPKAAEGSSAARRRTDGGEFPIPDYDSLEVVEVLPLLGDLEPAELEMVRQREASSRAHPWILARVDALLEAEADADTSEHTWAPGPIGSGGSGQGRLLDAGDDDIVEVEPDDVDWASPRDADWAASDFPLDSGSDYEDVGRGPAGHSPSIATTTSR